MTTTPTPISSPRRAMALPAVLLLVFVGLGIALGIHNYSTETYRRTARGTYATLSEVLAESAAEEAWYTLQRDVNTPGTELYRLFRDEKSFADFAVDLPVLKAKLADPQFAGYLTDRYDAASSFQALISMKWNNPYGNKMPGVSADGEFDALTPWERVGTVTIRGAAQASARAEGLANFRRMVVTRPFRLNKVTPPVPFDRSGLVILYPEHMTDVVVAGVLDQATTYAVSNAGKARLTPLLEQSDQLVQQATSRTKQFNDLYKGAASPPFGDHLTPPPRWLQKIIDQLGGITSAATRLDLQGSGRRPFLFNDEVMVARSTMANGGLGNLAEFNYEKKIREGVKPLNDLLGALQKIADLNNGILQVLSPVHRAVPYGAALNALVAPMYAIVPELVGSVRDICEGLHEKLMDPVLELLVGIGQVIAIAQKIIIEVPLMGQQAFAGFANQIAAAGSDENGVKPQVGQTLDLNNMALQGLPTNTSAMGFGLNMPLPNYSNIQQVNEMGGIDAGELVRAAGEGVLSLLMDMVTKELVTFITEQIALLGAKIAISVPATAAACAGPQAIVLCVPAKTALAIAFDAISRAVIREITQKLNRIASFKADAFGKIVQTLTRQVPVFKGILQDLELEKLLGGILTAAYEKRDISVEVDAWMEKLATTFAQKTQEAVTGGLDQMGGVLKGYVLRHRFRNLVEFDGSGAMGGGFAPNAGGGMFQAAGGGGTADGLNSWRNAFDRVYKESLWRKKATWIIKNKNEWDALISRYFEGVYLRGKDPSGDGTNRWRDDSYGPNTGYGLSGVVFYDGTEDLTLNFTGARDFIGKATLYVPRAKVIVEGCKMRDINTDALTVICAKPVKLPPTDVQISVHAIGSGDDCQVEMSSGTNITGSLILKRYTVRDQDNPKASLNGQLSYNENLNGLGNDTDWGIKASHLFVSISPYVTSRDMETQP